MHPCTRAHSCPSTRARTRRRITGQATPSHFVRGRTQAREPSSYSIATRQVVVLEHFLLLMKFFIAAKIPDVPLWVLKMKRYQDYLKKQGEEGAEFEDKRKQYSLALQTEYDQADDEWI